MSADRGSAELSVELIDHRTRERVFGYIALLPLSGTGGQVRVLESLGFGRRRRISLPCGTYQPVILTEPDGAPDPDPVIVDEGRRTVSLSVAPRRTFQSWLRVCDENGEPVCEAWVRSLREAQEFCLPDRLGLDFHEVDAYPGCSVSERMEDSAGRFFLRSWHERGRGWQSKEKHVVRITGHATVRVFDECSNLGDHEYSAVAPSLESIRETIRLPAGEIARDATIRADTWAWRGAGNRDSGRVWVRVTQEGHKDLRFRFRARDLHDLPLRTLRPLVRSPAR